MQSKKVTRLRAGVSYRFVISDRSSGHNFRLTGPRLNRELTSVGYTGTKSYLLKLGRGDLLLRLRPACRLHARPLPGLLSLDRRAGPPVPALRSSARTERPAVSPIAAAPKGAGGSPRCERATAVSTIATDTRKPEPAWLTERRRAQMEKHVRLKALRPVLLVALIVAVTGTAASGRRGRCRDHHRGRPRLALVQEVQASSTRSSSTVS